MTELAPAFGSFAGIIIGSGIVALWLKSRESRVTQLEGEVGKLRDRTVRDLSAKVERHIEADRLPQVEQKIDHVSTQLTKLDAKLDRIAETTANQAAKIEANATYIGNLDRSFQRHKEVAHNG